MNMQLQDIIDLDLLMDLDEKDIMEGRGRDIALRDRNIRKAITSDQASPGMADETSLILAWLDQRRQQLRQDGSCAHLSGASIESLIAWTGRIVGMAGFFSGLVTVYSFLAYHGVQPVNVTLFFTLFVLLPFFTCMFTLGALMGNMFRGRTRREERSGSKFRTAFFHILLQAAARIIKLLLPGTLATAKTEPIFALLQNKKRQYAHLLFWPMVGIGSSFALGFSLGTLLATLFRVVTADMAFGWQSTLTAAPQHIHELVSVISLPWSWILPQALPDLAQIQGSRIILKQGISALTSEHLASWWPFLSMAIVCYTILPRLVLMAGAKAGFFHVRNQYDVTRPRFRNLFIRMQSPVMDVENTEPPAHVPPDIAVTPHETASFHDPSLRMNPSISPHTDSMPKHPEKPLPCLTALPGILLAPKNVFDRNCLDHWTRQIQEKLMIHVKETVWVSMDLEPDQKILAPLVQEGDKQILVVQETWQPPIRGLMYYYSQLADTLCSGTSLWIVLVSDAKETRKGNIPRENCLDTEIWYKAVQKLAHPSLIVVTME